MDELLAHLVGDFLLQNSWMAQAKYNRWRPAIAHGFAYTTPFLVLTQNPWALLAICFSHILIDRFRWASVVPRIYNWDWEDWEWHGWLDERSWNAACQLAPYPADLLWVCLMIDQTLHLLINHLALGKWG